MSDLPRQLEGIRLELDQMIRNFERSKTTLSLRTKEALEHLVRARQAVGIAASSLLEKKA